MSPSLRRTVYLAIVVCSALFATACLAQVTEGNLTGTVTDPQGAAIADATITVTNTATGAVRTLATDKGGVYRTSFLQPGTYSVSAEHEGFSRATMDAVRVDPNALARADLQLKVGAVSTSVEVRTEALPMDVNEGRITSTLSAQQVSDLPTPGRDVYSLTLLAPGVTATLAPVISDTQLNVFNYAFSANGATMRGNNFVVDGVSNNNEWLGGTPELSPSVESIESFQVQTANFSPEFGRNNGAIVILTTKAGTNKFHGSLYDYLRNPATDASNRFDLASTGKTAVHRNDFGGSLGGPIRKNRTFFFFNYEGVREADARTYLGTGETPEFRAQVALYRPTSIANQQFQLHPSGPCVPGTSEDLGSIYDETIPLSTLQASVSPIVLQLDAGKPDGVPDTCETAYLYHNPVEENQYLARVDEHFTDKDTIFLRYLQDLNSNDVGPSELGTATERGFRAPLTGNDPSALLTEIHVFSPEVINNVRLQYARTQFGIGSVAPNSGNATLEYDYPALYLDSGDNSFGGAELVPRYFVFNNYTLGDTISVQLGRHATSAGFELERLQENSNYHKEDNGFYEFLGEFQFANDAPYYQTAAVNPVTGQFTSTPRHFRTTWFSFFLADDWKATQRLTLNLGLRYDLYGVPTETNGILSNITLASGATPAAQIGGGIVGRVSHLFDGDHNNFSPRVGFSYDVTGKGTTVIRGAAAMAYLAPYSNLYTNPSRFDSPDVAYPFVYPYAYGGTITYGVPALLNPAYETGLTPQGGITGTRITLEGVQTNLRTAYSEQYFVGFERKVGRSYYVQGNYVNTDGRQLYIRDDINRYTGNRASSAIAATRYNSQWGIAETTKNGPGSNYNGINVQLTRPMANHYSFTVNYTFGKALDEVSDPGLGDMGNVPDEEYNGTIDEQNPRLDYGRSDFDVRHRLTATAMYMLPSPHGKFVAKELLGGWQLNSVVSLQSGRPFSVFCANITYCDYNGDGDALDRPNTPTYGNTKRGLSRSSYINGMMAIADFPDPNNGETYTQESTAGKTIPEGKDGNLGRNTFPGPGYADVDASLFKSFALPHETHLQFRAEAFNLFNRVNLYLPYDTLSSSSLTFGHSTIAFPARNMQFALKYLF